MREEESNIEFISSLDFDLIENLLKDGCFYILNFDDSCEEVCRSKRFEKKAFVGRHRKLKCIYKKHNLFLKGASGRDTEFQKTNIVLFKSAVVNKLRY